MKRVFKPILGAVFVLSSSQLFGCFSSSNPSPNACTPSSASVVSVTPAATAQIQHIPLAIKNLSDQGKLSRNKNLAITISLKLNNEEELDQKIAEMYQPGNRNFKRFLTSEEFRSRYSATQDQINDTASFLASHGIQAVNVNPNGYMMTGIGTPEALGEAFQTEIHEYQDINGNHSFAPTAEPRIPLGLSIRGIHGLHNLTHLKSNAHLNPSGIAANAGKGVGGALAPQDIRSIYNIPTSVTGTGQTLALVELDGYNPSDIAAYEKMYSLPSVPLQNILVDGASGFAGQNASEVTLDIELMTAVAPGASKILIYEAANTAQSLLDVYSKIANDNLASQISSSWGAPESEYDTAYLQSENTILKQMAVQGQSMYVATGDEGAYNGTSNLSVQDPASQPFVVAVGGTHLISNSGAYLSESAWADSTSSASGGGVSKVWSLPSWQNGIATAKNLGSSSMRNVPDVSLNADPGTGYSIYVGGTWTVYGGTSCAAPIWAAFTALVNQQRLTNGLGPIGFTAPDFYSLAKGSRYGSDFRDVIGGSNFYYPAVSGYDNATGLGSFNGQNLFQDLIQSPSTSVDALSC